MKSTLLFIVVLCFIFLNTLQLKADVHTVWIDDTVYVDKDIIIDAGEVLEIHSGVTVLFEGKHRMIVNGTLMAVGTESSPITFTPRDTVTGWNGILFQQNSAQIRSKIDFCDIRFSKYQHNGGAIALDNCDNVLISNSLFYGNETTGESYDGGAAIYADDSKLVVDKCTFVNNKTSITFAVKGGAIFGSYSNLLISNCLFDNNYGYYGGAVTAYRAKGESSIVNCLFKNNSSRDGGALKILNCDRFNLINNTYVSNYSAGGFNFGGGALCVDGGNVTEINAIYWNNTCSTGQNIYIDGSFQTGYYTVSNSCIENDILSIEEHINGSEQKGFLTYKNVISKDPEFVDNISDFHLTSSSPCVNAGTIKGVNFEIPEYDFDNNNRIIWGKIDMGAFELTEKPDSRLVIGDVNPGIAESGVELEIPVEISSFPDECAISVLIGSDDIIVDGRTLKWTPQDADKGQKYIVKIEVDNGDLKKTQTFEIRVKDDKEFMGEVTTDLVWPYDSMIVIGNITILDGAKLTYKPGTKVCFEGAYGIDVKGTIIAASNAEEPIEFNRLNDGYYWSGFNFNETSNHNDSSVFRNCIMEYSGSDLNGGLFKVVSYSKILIENNIIRNNISFDGDGGAISLRYSYPTIRDNEFINNSAESGGAITIYNYSGNQKISGNRFINNYASSSGGAIGSRGKVVIVANYFEANSSGSYSGGVISHYGDDFWSTIANNVFVENEAPEGGVLSARSATINFVNNTCINNTSTKDGSVILAKNYSHPVSKSIVNIYNCIFWNDNANYEEFITKGDESICNMNYSAMKNYSGTETDNISLTESPFNSTESIYEFNEKSVCYNAGLNSICDDLNLTTDFNFSWRKVFNRVDIGAIEIRPNGWPVISWPEFENITYGQSLSDAMVSNGEADIMGVFLIDDKDEEPDAGVQNVSAKFIPEDPQFSNVALINDSLSFNVNKKELNVRFDDMHITFGDSISELSPIYSGFVNENDESMFEEHFIYHINNVKYLSAGEYTITPENNFSHANYTANVEPVNISIAKKDLDIFVSPISVIYGDTLPELSINCNGLVINHTIDSIVPAISFTKVAIDTLDAGVYYNLIQPVTSENDYYNLNYTIGDLVINKKQIDVNIEPVSIVYGESLPGLSISCEGFLNGDSFESMVGNETVKFDDSEILNAGVYNELISVTPPVLTNYDLNYNIGPVVVQKKELVFTTHDVEVVYGDEEPDISYTCVGFVFDDDESLISDDVDFYIDNYSNLKSGYYTDVVKCDFEGTDNYTASFNSGTVTIQKRNVVVEIEDVEVEYGDQIEDVELICEELVFGQSFNDIYPDFTLNIENFDSMNAGTYDNPVITNDSVFDNYIIDYQMDELLITKAKLDVYAADATYDINRREPIDYSILFSGFKKNDHKGLLDEIPEAAVLSIDTFSVNVYPEAIRLFNGYDENYEYVLHYGTLTVVNTTSVDNVYEEPCVYPVPVKQLLTIRNLNGAYYKILNTSGKLMISGTCQSNNQLLDVSGFLPGIYHLDARLGKRIIKKKIIKQ